MHVFVTFVIESLCRQSERTMIMPLSHRASLFESRRTVIFHMLDFLVALAIRYALKAARTDAGITELQEFPLPLTSERICMAAGGTLAKQGTIHGSS
jgi:hypothetical protein